MNIKEKVSGGVFTVYGIYWHNNKTYFYAFPKNSMGISSFGEEEVEIIDRAIGSDFEYLPTDGYIAGIFHKYLLAEALMDDLLEHDPDAYKKFVTLLGKEPNAGA